MYIKNKTMRHSVGRNRVRFGYVVRADSNQSVDIRWKHLLCIIFCISDTK